MAKVIAILGWVIGIPFLVIWWGIGGSAEMADIGEASTFERKARVVCSAQIERSLRNPASVEWRDMATWPIIEDGENLHTVIAKYRAENGFGGLVNETRQCLVMRRDDNATILGIE